MLERMTEIIAADGPLTWIRGRSPLTHDRGTHVALLESSFEHLSELCAMAKQLQLPLLLDAEQSNRQPAIDFMCRRLQQRFNVSGGAGAHGNNIIYNTFQMYMVGAERRLARDLAHAQRNDHGFAVKLVRGAYLVTEVERARKMGRRVLFFRQGGYR